MRRRTILACVALAAGITASATNTATAQRGFRTEQASMLSAVKAGVQIRPLMTVGDTLASGYRFEAIPDGISVRNRRRGRVELFVNHETGKATVPYNPAAPCAANGENVFDFSQVSRLTSYATTTPASRSSGLPIGGGQEFSCLRT